jgi:hypothetical protein
MCPLLGPSPAKKKIGLLGALCAHVWLAASTEWIGLIHWATLLHSMHLSVNLATLQELHELELLYHVYQLSTTTRAQVRCIAANAVY